MEQLFLTILNRAVTAGWLVLLVMVLLTIPALVCGKLSRVQGVALLCIYAAFCAVQFTM